MDDQDIEKRLKEATDNCLKAYGAWTGNEKESEKRETLMECVHELRKVAARLEISIAISERDQMASKPIPIPAHKSSRRGGGGNKDGNAANDGSKSRSKSSSGGRRTRSSSSNNSNNSNNNNSSDDSQNNNGARRRRSSRSSSKDS